MYYNYIEIYQNKKIANNNSFCYINVIGILKNPKYNGVIIIKNNVLTKITNEYLTLSKPLKRIADYILSNTSEPQYLSIYQLAAACEVSESSVFRFCQILGFKGYKEFKYALAEANSAKLIDGEIDAYEEILPEDTFMEMAKKLFAYNMTSVNQTLQLIDKEQYEKAAKYLKQAKHIYCFGQGSSGIMAQELWGRFVTVSNKFSYIPDSHFQAILISNCTKDDVVILFSYSGATEDGPKLLEEARNRGAKTILITHYHNSFAAKFADIILLCGSRESPKQTGSIAARMAQLFVIDLLFNEFYRLDRETSEEAINRTSEIMEKKLLRYKP